MVQGDVQGWQSFSAGPIRQPGSWRTGHQTQRYQKIPGFYFNILQGKISRCKYRSPAALGEAQPICLVGKGHGNGAVPPQTPPAPPLSCLRLPQAEELKK